MKKLLIFGILMLFLVSFVFADSNNTNQTQSNETNQTQSNETQTCIGEGGKGNFIISPDIKCCPGLKQIANSWSTEGGCIAPTDGSFICSYCGNGECGKGENFCNCQEDCETSDTNTTTLIKVQTKNRLKIHKNQSECPENCTCTGSVTKCRLADGTREMTVMAGKSGNVIVQVKGINMSTNVTLYHHDGKVYGVFKDNETKEVGVMPDEIKEKLKQKIRARLENHNITLRDDGIYEVQMKKRARLFFLFPVREKTNAEINAETGEIIKIRNPWWGFLARDVKEEAEEEILNESECMAICAEKGLDYYGDCAYDDLNLSAERVGTCIDPSLPGCDEKPCGCYCLLPSPT